MYNKTRYSLGNDLLERENTNVVVPIVPLHSFAPQIKWCVHTKRVYNIRAGFWTNKKYLLHGVFYFQSLFIEILNKQLTLITLKNYFTFFE